MKGLKRVYEGGKVWCREVQSSRRFGFLKTLYSRGQLHLQIDFPSRDDVIKATGGSFSNVVTGDVVFAGGF